MSERETGLRGRPGLRVRILDVRRALQPFGFVRKSPPLRRIQVAWAGAFGGDAIVAVAFGVMAYEADGARGVAILVAAQMLPAAIVAPLVAAATHRFPRERLLLGIDLIRAVVAAAAAMLAAAQAPNWILLVLAATLMTATAVSNPARRAVVPLLVTTPAELTATSVVSSVVQATAVTLGPAIAALLYLTGQSWTVFAAAAAFYIVGGLAEARLPSTAGIAIRLPQSAQATTGFRHGLDAVRANSQLKLAAAMFAAKNLARGALTVLVVVVPLQLLGLHASAVGLLTAAIGIGGILGGIAAAALVGRRRLAGPMALGLAAWGAPLLALGLAPGFAVALAGLAVLGGGNTVTDVAGYTLIARSARDDLLTRVLGVHEGIRGLAITLGSAATALLINLGSVRISLAVVGAGLGVAAALAGARREVEPAAEISDDDIKLLRANPLFGWLPPVAFERVAFTLTHVELDAGEVLIRQGDEGDRAYLVATGELSVERYGEEVARVAPGAVVGEIALLHAVSRTATVRAVGPVRVLAIDGDEFLAAATGGATAREAAEELVTARLAEVTVR
jgi:predicted MFS family arabinose efflux permease